MRCRKFILGGDIRFEAVDVQHQSVSRFDLAVVILSFEVLSGLYLGSWKVARLMKLTLGRDIAWGCSCATS